MDLLFRQTKYLPLMGFLSPVSEKLILRKNDIVFFEDNTNNSNNVRKKADRKFV